MDKYRLVAKKGEGTFSEVIQAQSLRSNKMMAIKCMKSSFPSIDQVNSLREIQALKRLSPHPGIIKLCEVLYDPPTGRLALVFELMDMNIYELIKDRKVHLPATTIKNYMYQLMVAMDHMHRHGIFHRDIKPENILIADKKLKIADFGSCRGIYSKQPYTEYISTRWYRAPECLLTDGYYGYKMDIWGVGCVMFEIVSLFPLFPGADELDQIDRIHNIMGTPRRDLLDKFKQYATHMEFNFEPKRGTGIAPLIAHADSRCIDLISKLLTYDPERRVSARQALRHEYFDEIREAEQAKPEKIAANQLNKIRLLRNDRSSKPNHHSTSNMIRKPKLSYSASHSLKSGGENGNSTTMKRFPGSEYLNKHGAMTNNKGGKYVHNRSMELPRLAKHNSSSMSPSEDEDGDANMNDSEHPHMSPTQHHGMTGFGSPNNRKVDQFSPPRTKYLKHLEKSPYASNAVVPIRKPKILPKKPPISSISQSNGNPRQDIYEKAASHSKTKSTYVSPYSQRMTSQAR